MKAKLAKKILKESHNFYESSAEEFSRTRHYLWDEIELIKKYIPNSGKILDLGCGNGRLLEMLGQKTLNNLEYVGLDSSENMLSEARKLHPNNNFILGDALNIPLKDNTFDAIASIAVLHHIPSKEFRKKFFDECARVLKKDGILIITSWNLWRKKFLLKILKSVISMDFGDVWLTFGSSKKKRYLHAFSRRELKQLAQNSEFKILYLKTIDNSRFRSNIVLIAKKN